MLTDTVNGELKDRVGPEDILSESKLEELQYALDEQARRILKTNRAERLERRVKRAIEKTLIAPQVEKLTEVRHIVHVYTVADKYLLQNSQNRVGGQALRHWDLWHNMRYKLGPRWGR